MLNESFMYIAVVLIIWGTWHYIQDIYHSDIRPNLVTWFLWTLAPLIAFTSQLHAGITPSAVLTLMVGLCPLAVFLAGLKKGEFRPTRFDLLCAAASLVAFALWQLTGSGTVAVLLSIVADGLAASPTLLKAYRDPGSESSFLFLLFAVSAAVTLLTLNKWTIESSGFSLYIFSLYLILYALVRFELGNPPKSLAEDEDIE